LTSIAVSLPASTIVEQPTEVSMSHDITCQRCPETAQKEPSSVL
jgi:hypothetical protein